MANEQMNDEMLLDETLDDLADLPQVAPFPPGAHLADMFIKRDTKKPSTYIVEFVHKATLELVNPDHQSPKAGDKATLWIHTKKKDGSVNEFGQGQLKQILTPLSERLQEKSVGKLIEATKSGVEVALTSGIRKQDGQPDQMTIAKLMLS